MADTIQGEFDFTGDGSAETEYELRKTISGTVSKSRAGTEAVEAGKKELDSLRTQLVVLHRKQTEAVANGNKIEASRINGEIRTAESRIKALSYGVDKNLTRLSDLSDKEKALVSHLHESDEETADDASAVENPLQITTLSELSEYTEKYFTTDEMNFISHDFKPELPSATESALTYKAALYIAQESIKDSIHLASVVSSVAKNIIDRKYKNAAALRTEIKRINEPFENESVPDSQEEYHFKPGVIPVPEYVKKAFGENMHMVIPETMEDYTGAEHDRIILTREKDILKTEYPSYLLPIPQEAMKYYEFMPPLVRDGDSYVVVCHLNGWDAAASAVTCFRTTLDIYVATVDFAEKKQKMLNRQDAEQKNKKIKADAKLFIDEAERRGITDSDAFIRLPGGSMRLGYARSLIASPDKIKPQHLSYAKVNKMSYQQCRLIEAKFDLPEQGRHPSRKIWEAYAETYSAVKQKSLDENCQLQDWEDAHSKGEKTSYGDSGLNDTLLDAYGIHVKRQNGDVINRHEISEIKKAVDDIYRFYGNFTEINRNFGLKISHSADMNMHARKSVGLFYPSFHAIGIKFDNRNDTGEELTNGPVILSHEFAHYLDYMKGSKSHYYFSSDKNGTAENDIACAVRRTMNKGKSVYINRTCECYARAMEEYFTLSYYPEFAENLYKETGYIPEDVFRRDIMPLCDKSLKGIRELFDVKPPVEVIQAKAAAPAVKSEEEYLAERGASQFGFGEPAFTKMNAQKHTADIERQRQKDMELSSYRSQLRQEYADKVAGGKIRNKGEIEREIEAANGHPDNEQTRAARRMLQKRGIDWKTGSKINGTPDNSDAEYSELVEQVKEYFMKNPDKSRMDAFFDFSDHFHADNSDPENTTSEIFHTIYDSLIEMNSAKARDIYKKLIAAVPENPGDKDLADFVLNFAEAQKNNSYLWKMVKPGDYYVNEDYAEVVNKFGHLAIGDLDYTLPGKLKTVLKSHEDPLKTVEKWREEKSPLPYYEYAGDSFSIAIEKYADSPSDDLKRTILDYVNRSRRIVTLDDYYKAGIEAAKRNKTIIPAARSSEFENLLKEDPFKKPVLQYDAKDREYSKARLEKFNSGVADEIYRQTRVEQKQLSELKTDADITEATNGSVESGPEYENRPGITLDDYNKAGVETAKKNGSVVPAARLPEFENLQEEDKRRYFIRNKYVLNDDGTISYSRENSDDAIKIIYERVYVPRMPAENGSKLNFFEDYRRLSFEQFTAEVHKLLDEADRGELGHIDESYKALDMQGYNGSLTAYAVHLAFIRSYEDKTGVLLPSGDNTGLYIRKHELFSRINEYNTLSFSNEEKPLHIHYSLDSWNNETDNLSDHSMQPSFKEIMAFVKSDLARIPAWRAEAEKKYYNSKILEDSRIFLRNFDDKWLSNRALSNEKTCAISDKNIVFNGLLKAIEITCQTNACNTPYGLSCKKDTVSNTFLIEEKENDVWQTCSDLVAMKVKKEIELKLIDEEIKRRKKFPRRKSENFICSKKIDGKEYDAFLLRDTDYNVVKITKKENAMYVCSLYYNNSGTLKFHSYDGISPALTRWAEETVRDASALLRNGFSTVDDAEKTFSETDNMELIMEKRRLDEVFKDAPEGCRPHAFAVHAASLWLSSLQTEERESTEKAVMEKKLIQYEVFGITRTAPKIQFAVDMINSPDFAGVNTNGIRKTDGTVIQADANTTAFASFLQKNPYRLPTVLQFTSDVEDKFRKENLSSKNEAAEAIWKQLPETDRRYLQDEINATGRDSDKQMLMENIMTILR